MSSLFGYDHIAKFRSKISGMSPQGLSKFLKWGPKRTLYWYQSDHVKQMLLSCINYTSDRHGMILGSKNSLSRFRR